MSFLFLKIPNFAVGILNFSQSCLVKILDPSSCEANLFGPNTLILNLSCYYKEYMGMIEQTTVH